MTRSCVGRRSRACANGAVTTLTYDPVTFRISRILTVRSPDNASLQDLNYTYDPIGNITQIRDDAQQVVYFNNQVVTTQNDFVYDAVYRLISATGREHIGQNAPVDEFDATRVGLPHPSDGAAMQRYRQQYDYDHVGNLLNMVHSSGAGPFINQWTRQFTPAATSNRLTQSQVGGAVESYAYDVHGNMTALAALPTLAWDFKDELRSVDLGGGGTAYYSYDAAGNRTRKVIQRRNGSLMERRLYLGALEIYDQIQVGVPTLERQTLHLMDGTDRLAMIDSRTVGDDGTPAQLIRYQFANHLGTAVLELDDASQIISYEEYYPYGSTSFQSVDGSREVPARRYRYTGRERDEESGLYYHGARYYAPWLARWISCDPAGTSDGLNLFAYAHDSPLRFSDPNGRAGRDQQLWLDHLLTQTVRATRSGRGFDDRLNSDMTKASDAFGPGGPTDVGHDKPFAVTPSGELGTVRPQPRAENRSLGATEDKQAAEEARTKGEFAREGGVDVAARSRASDKHGRQRQRGAIRSTNGKVLYLVRNKARRHRHRPLRLLLRRRRHSWNWLTSQAHLRHHNPSEQRLRQMALWRQAANRSHPISMRCRAASLLLPVGTAWVRGLPRELPERSAPLCWPVILYKAKDTQQRVGIVSDAIIGIRVA